MCVKENLKGTRKGDWSGACVAQIPKHFASCGVSTAKGTFHSCTTHKHPNSIKEGAADVQQGPTLGLAPTTQGKAPASCLLVGGTLVIKGRPFLGCGGHSTGPFADQH